MSPKPSNSCVNLLKKREEHPYIFFLIIELKIRMKIQEGSPGRKKRGRAIQGLFSDPEEQGTERETEYKEDELEE